MSQIFITVVFYIIVSIVPWFKRFYVPLGHNIKLSHTGLYDQIKTLMRVSMFTRADKETVFVDLIKLRGFTLK